MPKYRMSGSNMSRCCPVKLVRLTMLPSRRSSSAITGAILMASGRVPKTVRILSMRWRARPPQRAGIEEILHRPADLGAGDVLRAFAVAAVEPAGRILDPLEILQRPVGPFRRAEPVPDHRILCDAGRADPLH